MDQLTFLVFFIYGLAFFGMGITMALESGRSPALAQARVLRPLAAFGLIHGTHEWMESYLMQAEFFGTPLPGWLSWLRLGFLFASFGSLLLYGIQMLLFVSPYNPEKRAFRFSVFGFYALFIISNIIRAYIEAPIPLTHLLDGLGRYLLAVPAAMLATLALRAQAREMRQNDRMQLNNSLLIAAFGFGIYTLTQLFVHPINMFPARYFNEETFLAFTGFPIQVIRTIMAILVTYGLLRATQSMEEERKAQLFAAQQARLEALEQQEEIRRELLRHTVQAQEDERARIARELHDEISQLLSAFTLELATLRELAKGRPRMKNTVDRLQDLSRLMSNGLYNLVHGLRPAQLDDLGLVPALQSLLDSEYGPNGLQVTFNVTGTQQRLELADRNGFIPCGAGSADQCHAPRRNQPGKRSPGLCSRRDHIRGNGCRQRLRPKRAAESPRGWGLEGMRERVASVQRTIESVFRSQAWDNC